MTKVTLGCWFLIAIAPSLVFALPPQPTVPGGIEPGLAVRAFKDLGSITLAAEAGALNETDGRDYRDIMLGGYYQLTENLSTGLFYERAYGLRHDDDWNKTTGTWSWADTNSRGEDLLIADLTARFKVFESTVFEIKARYLDNLFNQNQTLFLRPGLTYFWLKDEQPFMNFFLQYEIDLPLNFDNEQVDERWLYLGALYRVMENVDVGGFYALNWQAWHSSADYLAKLGSPYTVTSTSAVISALAIVHF